MTTDLTARETQVLTLLADGHTLAQIGEQLHLCRSTVKTHAEALRTKLRATNTAHAVHIAHQAGLLPGPATTAGSSHA